MFTQVQTLSGVFVLDARIRFDPSGPYTPVTFILVMILSFLGNIALNELEQYCIRRNAALAWKLKGENRWIRSAVYLIDGLIALGSSLVIGAVIGGFILGNALGGSQWFFLVTLILFPFALFGNIRARRKIPAPYDPFLSIKPGPVIADEEWTLARREPAPQKPFAPGGSKRPCEPVNPSPDGQPDCPDPNNRQSAHSYE